MNAVELVTLLVIPVCVLGLGLVVRAWFAEQERYEMVIQWLEEQDREVKERSRTVQ